MTAFASRVRGRRPVGPRTEVLAAQLLVIAKAPVPGRVKTRLTPPFSPVQAAQLAAAALADTLAAAARVPAARHLLALEGAPGRWLPAGFDVVAQHGTRLDERIAAALGQAYAGLRLPVVLIGMDTPQVTPELLEAAIRPLLDDAPDPGGAAERADTPCGDVFAADATLGMADDGGFWLLGLRRPDPRLVTGVPMSTPHTGAAQLARLAAAGLRVRQMPSCTDVDTAADAVSVARQIPRSRFAAALRSMPVTPEPRGRLTGPRVLRHCYLITRCEPNGPFSWLAAIVADQKRRAWRGARRGTNRATRARAAGRAMSAVRLTAAPALAAALATLSATRRLYGRAGTLALERAGACGRRAVAVLDRPAGLLRQAASGPPRGPFRPGVWRSPLRGRWLTSLLGLVLLAGLPLLAVTGLLSYAAYDPRLAGNDETPGAPLLKFFLFPWFTHPDWIYRVNQGIHVTLGLALLPVVLAKLWSVLPRLFAWPPVESVAHALERLSLLMIVGGVLFEFTTGILDIQDFYVVPSFYTAHLYGAWVFIAGLVIHVTLKFPQMRAGLRSRSLRRELRTPLAATRPEDPDPSGLRAADPAPPTISRRGLLAAVGGGSLTLVALSAGQSIGGWARRTALLAPRGLSAAQSGALPVNRTAAAAAVTAEETGDSYRLVLAGARTVRLTREQILALPQHTAVLPIACVEGWSFAASWTGVRLADLARLAGITRPGPAVVESLEKNGAFRRAALSAAQVSDPQSALALRLNGSDLPRDHGYPARVIVPAAPGVHNTKWVGTITFMEPG